MIITVPVEGLISGVQITFHQELTSFVLSEINDTNYTPRIIDLSQ